MYNIYIYIYTYTLDPPAERTRAARQHALFRSAQVRAYDDRA